MAKIDKIIKQLESEDPAKREEAILALSDLRDERAVEPLIKVVQQDTVENRVYAIVALSEIGDHRAIETLIYCLMDYNEKIRMAAARALGKFSSPQAINALLVSLKNDPSLAIRSRAALSLGSIGSELAVEDLLRESKIENATHLLYSIDTALKMIAKKNGYESVEELIEAVRGKQAKHEGKVSKEEQMSEKEQLESIPRLWEYIRKYVYQQLEGIQTILSIEADEQTVEKKIADILGEKYWKFVKFLENKFNIKLTEFQTDLLWQMVWDTSLPIREEIFQMIRDHQREVQEIERYRKWLEKIEQEKEEAEILEGEPIFGTTAAPPTANIPQADIARSISGEIEDIMQKYATWKGQQKKTEEEFEIE
ncbi:MAG: HEAT repeat domain-containing protein [Candidatus Heimdallarchaeaceae archaeon]